MKQYFTKVLAFLAMVILGISSSSVMAFAAEGEVSQNVIELETIDEEYEYVQCAVPYSTTFSDTAILISFSEAGMRVTIHTATTMTASVLGVKDIKVQIKSGNNWITVATATGGETTNNSGYACSFTYPNSIKGETYRVTCTHYANVDGYRELPHETLGAKCTY